MKSWIKHSIIQFVLCLCLVSSARADLAQRIDSILKAQRGVKFSVHIVEADSGKILYEHQATKALIPASNMKIIVTAAALKYLGLEFVYKTKVGLCRDNLVVVGSGDPLFGDRKTDEKYNREPGWIFEDIVASLKRHDVEIIEDIIVDSSIFDNQRVHSNWPKKELNRWYACEVCGLNFNDNCIEITTENISGQIVISIEPHTNYVELINKVTPISKGRSTIGAYRNRLPNKITIRGRCRTGTVPFDVAIEKPAMFFGFLLAENLAQAGINTKGQLIEKTLDEDCDFRLLAEYRTSITDCLARANKDSLGLAAEALLKTVGAYSQLSNGGGSWASGREVIGKYLLSLDIDPVEFHIDDGSGLSRENRLSANAITKVLLDLYKSKYWFAKGGYKASLAVGGVDGTISKYFKNKKYKGRIFGKTGYIKDVKSFSGVCCTDKGDFLFSILANKTNGRTREAINKIAMTIVDEAEDDV